jgi:multiple sugar transport system permease protein
MVYPFLVMVGKGMTSAVDQHEQAVLPKYLTDAERVFVKFVEDKYADSAEEAGYAHGVTIFKVGELGVPVSPPAPDLVRRWREFVAALPPEDYNIGYRITQQRLISLLNEKYQEYCRVKFGGDLERLNREYAEENTVLQTIEPPFEKLQRRDFQHRNDRKTKDWLEFKQTLPTHFRIPICGDRVWQEMLNGEYKSSVEKLNAAWGTNYASIQQIPFGDHPPSSPVAAKLWERCLRERLPYRYVLMAGPDGVFRRCDQGLDLTDPLQRDELERRIKQAPLAALRPDTLEHRFAAQVGTKLDMPVGNLIAHNEWDYVQSHLGALRWDFATRNYRYVLNYILLHGRAVWVTLFFCIAVVVTHLIVNPLCAYALSRFPMRATGRILLFLLATMAFPAEVAMIPNFLLLKSLGMLNTYWALVLPGMASGFAIFLLKGFFDSLPRELYEAGTIDGAGELTLFRRVTMPLSKPIFAVIALQSFLAAYGAFMYAFLVCQDQRMWTVMVWLYQLQVRAPKFLTMAALTLAAIPTLVVFMFAQNVIMRGIILPSEK